MVQQIVNAAPMVIDLGIRDLSSVPVNLGGDILPQHLPKFYTFAAKGDTLPHIVSGAERDRIFGTETFNLLGKYATHCTPWINAGNAEGNMMVLQRLVPEDAGPQASVVLWMDVLPTKVDDYQRNADGSIKLNAANEPTVIGQVDGYRVKFVKTFHKTVTAMDGFGTLDPIEGDQVDTLTSVRSTRYPIIEKAIAYKGATGNDYGFRLWSPNIETDGYMPTKLMEEEKCYPYYVSVIERQDGLSTAKVVKTIYNEQKIMVTLKPDVADPLTTKRLYYGETFLDSYQNLTNSRYELRVGDFGKLRVYQANIETLVKMFHTAEIPFINAYSDFTADEGDAHLFNFIGGTSSAGTPYHSFIFTDEANSVRLSAVTNIYAEGGSDGTMTAASFNALAKADMLRYLDDADPLAGDIVAHPESTMWDTGWPSDVKYAMMSFFSVRKDTWVVINTYDVSDRTLTESEEQSLAVALRSRAQFYPESDYFGTATCRASIFSGSALIQSSTWRHRVPASYDFFVKICRYMGAANGEWKNGKSPSGAPGHIIDQVYDVSIPWIPKSVRNRYWDAGLNWLDRYDMKRFFWPSYKTVYNDDTSVLNSILTVAACCYLNRVSHAVWRDLSGRDDLSDDQLIEVANRNFEGRIKNKFDNRFTIIPDAHVTELDQALGYAWHMRVKIGANNMKTVMTAYLEAYRKSVLDATLA